MRRRFWRWRETLGGLFTLRVIFKTGPNASLQAVFRQVFRNGWQDIPKAAIQRVIDGLGTGTYKRINTIDAADGFAAVATPDGLVATLNTPLGLIAFIYPGATMEQALESPDFLANVKPVVFFNPVVNARGFKVPITINLNAGENQDIINNFEIGVAPPIKNRRVG